MNSDVLAWGITFDLTLTIPFLYYIFIVRSGRARPITTAAVFATGATIAAMVLPRENQQFLHELRFVVAPLEIITIALLIQRIRRGGATDHPVFAFVATELAVLRYAIAGWRAAEAPPHSFTVHKRSGWGAIVGALMIVIVAESIALHVVVQMWSVRAAWLLTFLDFYGALWLVGDWNALRNRPSFIDGGVLHVRYGLRWSADVALDNVVSCDTVRDESDWKRPRVLKVAMLDSPRYLLRLRDPIVAHGIAGLRKTIDAIAILPDDDDALVSALRF